MIHTPLCEDTGLRDKKRWTLSQTVGDELIFRVKRWGMPFRGVGSIPWIYWEEWNVVHGHWTGQGQRKILAKAHMLRDFHVMWMEVFTLGVILPDQVSWSSTETPTWDPGHLRASPDAAISKKASLEASSLFFLPPKWGSLCSTKTLIYRWRIMLHLKRYWVRKEWVLFASETR